ncbi:MAG: CRISPR-associated endonuclease Cas1 [Thermodesulfobacteriota bacterium]
MTVVYLTDQGAGLTKQGQRLVVEKEGRAIRSFHAFKIEQLVVMGQVHLSSHVLAFLLEQGIDTVFLTFHGRYRGRLVSDLSKNIELRRNQFRFMEDPARTLDLARRYVAGKIENCRVLLRRQNQKREDPELTLAVNRLRTALGSLERAEDLDALRGLEGGAAAAYFKGLGRCLRAPEFEFTKRTRRPPRDPVNALLSFGYTLLANTVETAVQTAGLDPYLGALHAPDYGRPSLVLDLMEEFRPLLVDSVVLAALNRQAMRLSDFHFNPSAEVPPEDEEKENLKREDLPVMMTHEGIKKFVTLFERRLGERVVYLPLAERLDWRGVLLAQARLVARHLEGQNRYAAYVWR